MRTIVSVDSHNAVLGYINISNKLPLAKDQRVSVRKPSAIFQCFLNIYKRGVELCLAERVIFISMLLSGILQ